MSFGKWRAKHLEGGDDDEKKLETVPAPAVANDAASESDSDGSDGSDDAKWKLAAYDNSEKITETMIKHFETTLDGEFDRESGGRRGLASRVPLGGGGAEGKITITLSSCNGLIKNGYALFRAKKQGSVSFAHDRGTIDRSTFRAGVWDLKRDKLLPPSEAGIALGKEELSKEEALEIAKALLTKAYGRIDLGENCAGGRGGGDPRLVTGFDAEGRLAFSVLNHVGMRGCVFDAYVLVLPQSKRDDDDKSKKPLELRSWRSVHPNGEQRP